MVKIPENIIAALAQGSAYRNDPCHSPGYIAYLQSERWALIRKSVLARQNYKCGHCNTQTALQVHHLTYARLGREWEHDVIALCEPCHVKADQARKIQTSNAQWYRRVHGWAEKTGQSIEESEEELMRRDAYRDERGDY